MSQDQTQIGFERLLQNDLESAERQDIITHLEQGPQGQRLLEAWRWIEPAGNRPAEVDLREAIMRSLPAAGSPRAFAELGEAVLEGWAHPDYRARLRAEPRDALAERGLTLPSHLDIEIVPPTFARLPQGNRVFIPLPEVGQPAIPAAVARRRLNETDFAWLLKTSSSDQPVRPQARAVVDITGSRPEPGRWLAGLRSLFAPQPAAAMLGVILIVAAGLGFANAPGGTGMDLTGTAGSTPLLWIPIAELLGGLGLIAYAIWSKNT